MVVPVDSHGVAFGNRSSVRCCTTIARFVRWCRFVADFREHRRGAALARSRVGRYRGHSDASRQGREHSPQGNGLAIAAALEDESYPVEEMIYDLANLDGGFRFCGEENRWAGRLAMVCQKMYAVQTIPG